jgi:arginyl-tRNA synthetase
MIRLSQIQFDTIYSRLGVKFDFALGESFYNPWLGEVVADLLAKKIARESEGAVGVFSDGSLPPKEDPFLVNRDGEWIADPALVRKSDGGFNYTTTDLATVDYRLKTWSPDEIVYVVDDRQSGHFKKLFLIFARWKPDAAKSTKLVHVGFGKILGDDGKPFKTRSGDTVKLGDLLDEAEERAFKIVSEKSSELPEAQRKEIARVVGLGAVKYADLLPNRQSDYIFSWDKMLALQGNTAPYLLYAYARIKSIFRKAESDRNRTQPKPEIILAAPEEITLAKHLLNFGLTLEAVAEEYRPNFLCNYLLNWRANSLQLLRKLPGAESRRRGHARFAAGVVRFDGARFEARSGNARHRNRRADVPVVPISSRVCFQKIKSNRLFCSRRTLTPLARMERASFRSAKTAACTGAARVIRKVPLPRCFPR